MYQVTEWFLCIISCVIKTIPSDSNYLFCEWNTRTLLLSLEASTAMVISWEERFIEKNKYELSEVRDLVLLLAWIFCVLRRFYLFVSSEIEIMRWHWDGYRLYFSKKGVKKVKVYKNKIEIETVPKNYFLTKLAFTQQWISFLVANHVLIS